MSRAAPVHCVHADAVVLRSAGLCVLCFHFVQLWLVSGLEPVYSGCEHRPGNLLQGRVSISDPHRPLHLSSERPPQPTLGSEPARVFPVPFVSGVYDVIGLYVELCGLV
uniref:Uncharacterized protein n=1 Tax=Cacopsylla melanoneura TaxID=428564 RepID=A0A8D8ZNE2_9HEMI